MAAELPFRSVGQPSIPQRPFRVHGDTTFQFLEILELIVDLFIELRNRGRRIFWADPAVEKEKVINLYERFPLAKPLSISARRAECETMLEPTQRMFLLPFAPIPRVELD